MADQPRDPNKSKNDAEKKQPETVLLTSEELRTISRGSDVEPPSATPAQDHRLPQGLRRGSDWPAPDRSGRSESSTRRIMIEIRLAPVGAGRFGGFFVARNAAFRRRRPSRFPMLDRAARPASPPPSASANPSGNARVQRGYGASIPGRCVENTQAFRLVEFHAREDFVPDQDGVRLTH